MTRPRPDATSHATDAKMLKSDVLIIGGGLVGGALAAALGSVGTRVVVVDQADPATLLDAGFDGRASAIALTSRRLLEATGVWRHVAEATPMREIRVSDGDSPLFLHYDAADVGEEPFGHMVENRHLRAALFARLSELASVTLCAPASVTRLERNAGRVDATLNDGRSLTAGLVVAAEGRASPTRDAAGIRVTRWDYPQVGIVCTVRHEIPHDYIAHEHFLPSGPFAILPLGEDRACIVWTERRAWTEVYRTLDDAAFTAEVARRIGGFLGEVEVVGPRWCYPLSLQFAERATDRRLALIGDAYHGMHPIAGQGLNMGFRDVASLAQEIAETMRVGGDPGDAGVLARYERARRFDNHLMLAMTDGLNRLFSNDIAPVRVARDLGLAAVNRLPAVKRTFMRHAMGMVGELPRLMRGEAL